MNEFDINEVEVNENLRKTNLLDFVLVIAIHKKFIVRFILLVLLVAIILLYLVLPRWYKSVAVVMPPKQKSALGLINSISRTASAPLRSLGIGSASDDLAQFQAILSSRRVMEAVISKFDLKRVYDLKSLEKTIKELEDNCTFTLGKEDVALEITVFDTDPIRAANLANYFVEALNNTYIEMSVTEARSNREFIETRVEKVKKDLHIAEEAYKNYQEKSDIIYIPEQGGGDISAVAQLTAMKVKKELEIGLIGQSSTTDNQLLQQLKAELTEINKKVDKIPEAGVQTLRLYREIITQEKILEYIVPLFEQAKIDEQRNTPSVVVLDKASPSEKPAKPKRLLTLALIGILSLILGYFIALLLEAFRRSRNATLTGDHGKINFIKQELNIKRLFR